MRTERQDFSRRRVLRLAGAAVAVGAMPGRARSATGSPANLFCTEAGRGRNIMLLHGWTADSHDWSWQLPVLESQYRVICVDLRGHGRSEVMPSGGYMPASYVEDIERLILDRYRGEKFILVGHSMGGQIAARLAVKRPDLLDAVVSVDGSLGFSVELASVFQNATDNLAAGDPGVVAPALFDVFYDVATPSALRRWHARRAQGMPPHVVRESFGPLFLGPDQVGVGEQSERFCRRVSVPFYHLSRDPAQAERMGPWLSNPHSKVEVWNNAGHWIMQDRPDNVNAAITGWINTL